MRIFIAAILLVTFGLASISKAEPMSTKPSTSSVVPDASKCDDRVLQRVFNDYRDLKLDIGSSFLTLGALTITTGIFAYFLDGVPYNDRYEWNTRWLARPLMITGGVISGIGIAFLVSAFRTHLPKGMQVSVTPHGAAVSFSLP